MRIAAVQPTTLIDYPDRIAAAVFTIGCDLCCPFCHNPELVLPALAPDGLAAADVLDRLAQRRGFLDGVVLTGGEPTLQPDLAEFIEEIRSFGYSIKLDTNGTRPERIEPLLEQDLLDYVAMDIKAPRARYGEFAGRPVDLAAIDRAIALVRRAPDGEFRTTVAPGLTAEDLEQIADWIEGDRRYLLQGFRSPEGKRLVDPAWADRPALTGPELHAAWPRIARRFPDGGVRA